MTHPDLVIRAHRAIVDGAEREALVVVVDGTITTVDVDGSRIAQEVMSVVRRHGAGEDIPHNSIDVGYRIIARESA